MRSAALTYRLKIARFHQFKLADRIQARVVRRMGEPETVRLKRTAYRPTSLKRKSGLLLSPLRAGAIGHRWRYFRSGGKRRTFAVTADIFPIPVVFSRLALVPFSRAGTLHAAMFFRIALAARAVLAAVLPWTAIVIGFVASKNRQRNCGNGDNLDYIFHDQTNPPATQSSKSNQGKNRGRINAPGRRRMREQRTRPR